MFTVVDAEWTDQLPLPGGQPRFPQGKFLVVRLIAQNTASRVVNIPLLELFGADGKAIIELDKGEGVADWWGLLRTLEPGDRQTHQILFDVRPGTYRLQLSDGGDPERERTALVEIPFKLKDDSPVVPPAQPQGY